MSERAKKIIDDIVRSQITERGVGNATAIICALANDPDGFEDDKFDVCMKCSREVRYRPYMPNLPKICLLCWGMDI